MEAIVISILAIVFFGYAIFQIVFAVRDYLREKKKYQKVWKKMDEFEKHLFKGGLSLFFFIPIVKNSLYAEDYIFQVLAEITPALASGMFLAGIIAFVKELHSLNPEDTE